MTTARLRSALAIAATAAALVALTSCAPAVTTHHAGGGSTTSSSPTPTPTPTVSSLNLTAPTPLINTDCSSIITAAQLHAAFGTKPVALLASNAIATGDLEATDTQIPALDYVRQAGGTVCVWSDAPISIYGGIGAGFPKAHTEQVVFLPNAQVAWQNQAKVSQYPGTMGTGSCDIGSCQLDRLVGTTWIDTTELNQIGSLADPFSAILDTTKADVTSAGTVGAIPTPDSGTLPLGSECTDFVDDAAASTAIGTTVASSQPLLAADYFSYYGIWSGAQDELKDHPCVWKHGATVVGHLSWLPGGAWAWNETKALPSKDGTATPLAVPSLAAGDTAFIRCSAADASCVADLVIGGNWVEAQVSQPGSTNRAAVTALAAAIATKLG